VIKHFQWSENDNRGRVAVALNNEIFTLATIAGQCPPARVLIRVLEQWGEMRDALNAINDRRLHRTAIAPRVGMSGAYTLLLIEERDPELADYPTRARLHVSMYGKLNQGVRMWGGDLVELSAAFVSRFDMSPAADKLLVIESPTRGEMPWEGKISLSLFEGRLHHVYAEDVVNPDEVYWPSTVLDEVEYAADSE
jgi:hypothetical protein